MILLAVLQLFPDVFVCAFRYFSRAIKSLISSSSADLFHLAESPFRLSLSLARSLALTHTTSVV